MTFSATSNPGIAQGADPSTAQGSIGLSALAQHAKLEKAAQEFESILITELWKSAQTGLGADNDSDDAAAGTIKDMGTEAMAKGMAAHGGLGIAKMVLQQLENKGDAGSRRTAAQYAGILTGH